MLNNRPVCMITGLGEGTGGFTARRFAKAGYRIAMLARTKERLDRFEKEIDGSKGYVCDVSDINALKDGFDHIVIGRSSGDAGSVLIDEILVQDNLAVFGEAIKKV